MVDPATIIGGLALANKAFKEIKQLCQNGAEFSSMSNALINWSKGCSLVEQEHKKTKQSLMGSSASEQAMSTFLELKQVREQRDELRQFMQLYGPPGSWNEFVQLERNIRMDQKKALQEKIDKRKAVLEKMEAIGVVAGVMILFTLVVSVGIYIYLKV